MSTPNPEKQNITSVSQHQNPPRRLGKKILNYFLLLLTLFGILMMFGAVFNIPLPINGNFLAALAVTILGVKGVEKLTIYNIFSMDTDAADQEPVDILIEHINKIWKELSANKRLLHDENFTQRKEEEFLRKWF